MNEKLQDKIVEINNRLEQLEGKERELKNFSAGLAKLMGDIDGDITGSGQGGVVDGWWKLGLVGILIDCKLSVLSQLND